MNSSKRRKATNAHNRLNEPMDLERRVKELGGRSGYVLGDNFNGKGKRHGNNKATQFLQTPQIHPSRRRPFGNSSSKRSSTPFSLSSKCHGVTPATSRRSVTKSKGPTSFHIVCALSENLARETCISSLDACSPLELSVTKQANGQTYAETLAYLELLQPHEVLFNEGRRNSKLAQKIVEQFSPKSCSFYKEDGNYGDNNENSLTPRSSENNYDNFQDEDKSKTVVKFLPRIYFDQTKGAELLTKVARDGTYDVSVVEEYIILASSFAVLHYTQHCLGAVFVKSSLHLSINSGGRGRMTIDRSSLLNLELLTNARTGKQRNSLIGTIDLTKTSVGSRLLRTNLMAPPTSFQTINARLDLVSCLLNDEDLFYSVLEHLEALPELDKMLSYLAMSPKGINSENVTARIASRGISALVCIKSILSIIPSFANILSSSVQQKANISKQSNSQSKDMSDDEEESERDDDDPSCSKEESCSLSRESDIFTNPTSSLSSALDDIMSDKNPEQLLRAILLTFRQPNLMEVLEAVHEVFTESTTYTRNSHAMRHQECFALKPNTNGMLDVVRKAFLANVDDIYRLADEYAETFNISVAVRETAARGYYLSIPLAFAHSLPGVFIQPVKNGRFIHCTTEEVLSLNARAQENVQDMLLMTHEKIQEVLELARKHYDALASLSDAIALLDMCHSFADNVASSHLPWCRPKLSDMDGTLSIRGGRYAIDTSENGVNPFAYVPNDTYAAPFQNFNVITGINGSGKTTYLKQIAIHVILAQCGSYVPAEEAFIPIRDRLCTRIGTYDDQEHNISTFMQEMKETALICNQCTERSLIIIDELGRATSNEDGVAIAWSISEFLLVRRMICFFVTHYPQLTRLGDVYCNVQNQHLGSIVHSNSDTNVLYTHKVMSGPCKVSTDYGIEMAATCGWPEEILNEARSLRIEINKKLPEEQLCKSPNIDSLNAKERARAILVDLSKHLVALKDIESRLSENAIRSYLEDLRSRVIPFDDEEVINTIQKSLTNQKQIRKRVEHADIVDRSGRSKSATPLSPKRVSPRVPFLVDPIKENTYRSAKVTPPDNLSHMKQNKAEVNESAALDTLGDLDLSRISLSKYGPAQLDFATCKKNFEKVRKLPFCKISTHTSDVHCPMSFTEENHSRIENSITVSTLYEPKPRERSTEKMKNCVVSNALSLERNTGKRVLGGDFAKKYSQVTSADRCMREKIINNNTDIICHVVSKSESSNGNMNIRLGSPAATFEILEEIQHIPLNKRKRISEGEERNIIVRNYKQGLLDPSNLEMSLNIDLGEKYTDRGFVVELKDKVILSPKTMSNPSMHMSSAINIDIDPGHKKRNEKDVVDSESMLELGYSRGQAFVEAKNIEGIIESRMEYVKQLLKSAESSEEECSENDSTSSLSRPIRSSSDDDSIGCDSSSS